MNKRMTANDLLNAGWHRIYYGITNETLWHHPSVHGGQTFHGAVKYQKTVLAKE